MANNKKKWQKNLKLVFHLSVSHTTIHVVKLIPCLSSKTTMTKKRKMATLMPFDDRQFKLGETCAMQLLFVLTRQIQKFLHDTRETSPLTALFIQSICTEQLFENSSHRASLLLICIPLSIHAIGRRNQDSP